MSLHKEKVHWIAGDDLMAAGKVFAVGVILYLLFPILSIIIILIGIMMAVGTLIGVENDLTYIDYVLGVED